MKDLHSRDVVDAEAVDAEASDTSVQKLLEHRGQFLAFLEKRLGNRALAEDILQEAFLRGLDKLDDLRSDESAVAWFYRILRNAVIDQMRRRATSTKALEALAAEVELAEHSQPDMHNAVCKCVAGLAETLKPEYADAVRRIDVDGTPVKDYATEIGTSSNNAAVRVFRAREALRKQVVRACGACATHGCLDCTCGSKKG